MLVCTDTRHLNLLAEKVECLQVTSDSKLDIQAPTAPSRRLSGLSAIVICQAFGYRSPQAFTWQLNCLHSPSSLLTLMAKSRQIRKFALA